MKKSLEAAVKLLHVLHPKHDTWHSICVTCYEIEEIERVLDKRTNREVKGGWDRMYWGDM